MTVEVDLKIRPVILTDQRSLSNLMHTSSYVHRHLDWLYPLDWIGSSPFYVLESGGNIRAALACPPDPPRIAWVRLFVNHELPLQESWNALWARVKVDLSGKGRYTVAAIVLQDWFAGLLHGSSFVHYQDIVMLESDGRTSPNLSFPAHITIRTMLPGDLPTVARIDADAFQPLWQNSLFGLQQAYPQAAIASVAEKDGEVIGYQISTRNSLGIHLARLAVRPDKAGQGVGRALVMDLCKKVESQGISRLTVNTQSDNSTSLALYKKTGFRLTGETFPVYQFQVV
jgi:ribosomal protein S18 acetylase RimI-like enzyme